MSDRKVRMGIDVGGTHTKAVAIDNATHEIIGKSSVKTTHDDKAGVATGVVQAFQNCLRENGIDPKDVIFVAHSTTQATNALIEGDVANVSLELRASSLSFSVLFSSGMSSLWWGSIGPCSSVMN